jgi:PAS domain S-box-containing protein
MGKNTTILVADDDPDLLLLTTQILRRAGYEILEASTGKECLEAVRAHHPDIVLLDVMLPDMAGTAVCTQIKTDEALQGIFVILMSGVQVSSDSQADGLNVGADGYIIKPIANKELLARIQSMVRIKRAEEALRESEESYRSLVETSPDAIFLHEEGKFVYLNPAAVRLYGAGTAEELYGKSAFDIVHPDDRDGIRKRTASILATGAPAPLKEMRIVHRNGSIVDVEATAGVSYYRGKKVIQVIQRDITERKQAEEKIKASLREKEVLLQEIHHRVKNNLQIISSLLYLQSTRTEHPEAISALRESRDRVKSMALIHERLYESPNLASIDVGGYVRSLVSDLRRSYITEDSSVRLTVNVGDIPLGITEAIPCGLIINELVSNAMKHAFPKGRDGEITIRLQRAGANQIALTVSDNGIGFPEQVDFRKSPSLGLTLVNSLVGQLEGSIELDRSKGTAFTIRFG